MALVPPPSIRRWLFLVLWLATLAAPADGQSPWPQPESDLPTDANLVEGALPNGLRYAILPNAEPRNRVTLRLLVAAGSLHEDDQERGLAHFVEHLVFRGTRSHPGDSLVRLLEKRGIGQGPDSNAFTNYDHTIYHLDLPDARAETLRFGLQVFREYAEEAVFDPKAIAVERNVILNEKAMRAKPDYLVALVNLEFLWPDSRHAFRAPIGTDFSVKTCTREQLVGFYDAWYRPERLAVIVVGEVAPGEAANLIRETLGRLRARVPARPVPPDLVPASAASPNLRVFTHPGQVGALFSLQHPSPLPTGPDTHARRASLVHLHLAMGMLQNRLEKQAHENPDSFAGTRVAVEYPLAQWQTVVASVTGSLGYWRRIAADLEKEHRRAFLHGFGEGELRVVRANLLTAYAQAERSAASRPSDWLAAQLAGRLLYGHPFTTAADVRRDLEPAITGATPEDCLVAFRRAWSSQAPHALLVGHTDLTAKSTELAEVLNNSRRIEIAGQRVVAAADFAYTDFGPAGELIRSEHVPDLDVRLSEFANGVRFNFKRTDFLADLVDIHVRVGAGKLTQPASLPGIDLLAGAAFTGGGLRRHSLQEMKDLLAGRAVQVSFGVDTDALVFSGRCARRDLLLCLQLIAAYLTDAAYRPEVLRDAHAHFGSLYASLNATPGGPIPPRADRLLAGGDARFGLPDPATLYSRTLAELETWLEPQFRHGPIEFSVVGDVPWEEAASAVGRTLGALAGTRPPPAADRGTPLPPLVKPAQPSVMLIATGTKQAGIAWYWPVPDCTDIHHERRLVVLSQLIGERLRLRIREKLGASYSPSATLATHDGFPAYTHLVAYAEVPPPQVAQILLVVAAEMEALRSHRAGDDEFQRVLQPLLRSREEDLRTNAYWGHTVLRDAQLRPQRLAAARDRATDFASITSRDVHALAKRYLEAKNCFVFLAGPLTAAGR